MKILRFEADSGTFVLQPDGAAATTADALEGWAAPQLADASLLGLSLGRRAVGHTEAWSVAVLDADELSSHLPRLEEAFAFPFVAPGGPLQLGDPLAPAESRASIVVPAGSYWVGLYPVSPEETFADFVLTFLPEQDLPAGVYWSELPRLDAARRTPDDVETPVPLPPYEDDIPEGGAADFMASLFGAISKDGGGKARGSRADADSPLARGLQALIDAELLELTDPGTLGKLADRLEDDAASDPFVLRHLGAWLVDQPEVDDVFGEDTELETIVRTHVS